MRSSSWDNATPSCAPTMGFPTNQAKKFRVVTCHAKLSSLVKFLGAPTKISRTTESGTLGEVLVDEIKRGEQEAECRVSNGTLIDAGL